MLKRIQQIVHVVQRVVQKGLMAMFLFVLYFIGFGLTSLFLRIFKPGVLSKKFVPDNVCWQEATGYEVDQDDNVRQS